MGHRVDLERDEAVLAALVDVLAAEEGHVHEGGGEHEHVEAEVGGVVLVADAVKAVKLLARRRLVEDGLEVLLVVLDGRQLVCRELHAAHTSRPPLAQLVLGVRLGGLERLLTVQRERGDLRLEREGRGVVRHLELHNVEAPDGGIVRRQVVGRVKRDLVVDVEDGGAEVGRRLRGALVRDASPAGAPGPAREALERLGLDLDALLEQHDLAWERLRERDVDLALVVPEILCRGLGDPADRGLAAQRVDHA
mmetsp:Transcript_15253/g.35483  ORF Transcript_15253/g.35483 Transcript_15253/m.35483 type:complete len:251 (+) Transcript_15253:1054-1806(+)